MKLRQETDVICMNMMLTMQFAKRNMSITNRFSYSIKQIGRDLTQSYDKQPKRTTVHQQDKSSKYKLY